MKTPNIFNILFRSADSANATLPQSCNYNLGSVLKNAPNLINFQKQAYCKIKVRYFSIKAVHGAGNPLQNIGTIEIRLNVPNPNTLHTRPATSKHNMESSSLIGVVPTEDAGFTHGNAAYDNEYFYVANPFQGDINISLFNAGDGNLIEDLTNNHPYVLLLEVCFDDNPAQVNDNSGKLNTNMVDYNLNGGYKY